MHVLTSASTAGFARARRALIARNLRAGPAFAAYFKHWRDEVPLRRAARLLMRQRNRTLQAAATVHHATVLARYGVTVWATHWKHELRRERAILQKRHDRLARGFGWLQGRRLRMAHLRVSQAFWRHRAHVVGWNALVRLRKSRTPFPSALVASRPCWPCSAFFFTRKAGEPHPRHRATGSMASSSIIFWISSRRIRS